MADQDTNIQADERVNISDSQDVQAPEILGVELSEELKKIEESAIEPQTTESTTSQASAPVTRNPIASSSTSSIKLPKISEEEFDQVIGKEEDIPNVPKKEFSIEEQAKQIDELVETYVPNPNAK